MRIVIFHGHSSSLFVDDLIEPLKKYHEVKLCSSLDKNEIYRLLQWANLAWAEWAAEHAVVISYLPKVCPILLRIHSYEVFSQTIHKINWNAIDDLIFVSPLIHTIFESLLPEAASIPTQVISNFIDTNRFSLKKDFKKTNKIASVQLILDGNKNPFFAIQCFYKLLQVNGDLTLHFTGEPGLSVESQRIYLSLKNSITQLGIHDKVFFEGNIAPQNMNQWLEDKDYLLSTSMFESFGANIAEAMSKGIMPLIYQFPGSERIFPRDCLFGYTDQCLDIFNSPLSPKQLRDYVLTNFSLAKQMAKFLLCFEEIVNQYEVKTAPENFVKNYWENRYKTGGNSGSGSYGRLARFKADVINNFVIEHNIENVLELGCGDGSQLQLANYKNYFGFDISQSAIDRCQKLFADDPGKKFMLYVPYSYFEETDVIRTKIDLAISLDVIFHLVEDDIYEKYMNDLFASSCKYVIIYSSNIDIPYSGSHERHRRFSRWIEKNKPEWRPSGFLKNKFSYNPKRPDQTSNSDFYFYEKRS